MGRKIPGKKHRTIKDPYKQKQKRLERCKVDNPPSNANEQEIPKSLLKIIELQAKAKEMTLRKRKRRKKGKVLLSVEKLLDKEPVHKGILRPDKFIPNLIQNSKESATHFIKRISLMTQDLINEVEFEKKFGVEIKKNPETGKVIEVKRLKKKKSKSKKKKLSEKRKAKLEMKKESLRNIKDFSQLKDKVEFGEMVHRPPNLPSVKKKEKDRLLESKDKVKYRNLLLNNVIENKGTNSTIKENKLSNKLEKERREKEQKFIVEAYRRLKKKISDS